MEFKVGAYRYRVYLVPGLSHPETGCLVDGLIDFNNREIYVSTAVSHRRWREIILHEYWHAWIHHFGFQLDEEVQCDRFAVATSQFMDDWHAQGGANPKRKIDVKDLAGCEVGPFMIRQVVAWTG